MMGRDQVEYIQRRTIVIGLVLIIIGFLYGFGYSYLVNHESLLQRRDAYEPVFIHLAQDFDTTKESEVLDSLNQISQQNVAYIRAVGAHTHAINLGLLVIFVGLLLAVAFDNYEKARWLVISLLGGACAYPAGLALQSAGFVVAGEVFALLGSAAVVIALGLFFCALFLKSDWVPRSK